MRPEASEVQKPACTVRAEVRKAMLADWEQEWTSQKGVHHARSFYRGPDPRKAKYVIKLARLELGRFVRIISGHNNLNFFQTKLGLWNDPLCRFCGEGPETITHLISTCPRLESRSRELFQGEPPGPDMKWSVRDLLNFSYIPGVNIAYEGNGRRDEVPAILVDDPDGIGMSNGVD